MAFARSDESSETAEANDLYEQLYTWSPKEDIWGGIRDSNKTNLVRMALIERFSPFLPPEQRSMAQFFAALEELEKVVADESAVAWSECEGEAVTEFAEGENNLRANTPLALYRHLRWIHRVFQNVPGASVTIR